MRKDQLANIVQVIAGNRYFARCPHLATHRRHRQQTRQRNANRLSGCVRAQECEQYEAG